MDGKRGPCAECMHFRKGSSIALETFNAFPASGRIRATLRAAQTQKRREERYQVGEFYDLLETNIKSKTESYPNRPIDAGIQYCGVDEFLGKFYCSEVKNEKSSDYQCNQFQELTSADRTPHSCETCAYNYQPYDQLLETLLQQVIGVGTSSNPSKLPEFKADIEQFLQSAAEGEYEDCIDGDGLLRTRPALLPICEAWSSRNRYVVGPVANAAERCSQWIPGPNERTSQVSATLSTLVARCEQAYQLYEQLFNEVTPWHDERAWKLRTDSEIAVGHAKADLIEFCLFFLGANPEFAKSMAARYSRQVWEPVHQSTPWTSKQDMWLSLRDGAASLRPAATAWDPSGQGQATSVEAETQGQVLRQMLPGIWQVKIAFLGAKEVQQLMFRNDGTCQGGGGEEGTWDVTGKGKLTLKVTKRGAVIQFSEIEPRRLAGTIRVSGALLKGKTVWTKTAG